MKKLLLLLTDLEIGGTPTVVRELAKRLARESNTHVEVACLAGNGPVGRELSEAGIRATALGACCRYDISVLPRLHQLITRNRFDTVFSFLLHANAAAAMIAPMCGEVRWIQSIQTTQPNPHWHWTVQSVAQHAAEAIVVPSPSVAAAARRWADVPDEKIHIIPNAVEPSEFSGIHPGDGRRIGFLGRLDPVKRIGDLAHALLPPDFSLHIFGQGPEKHSIESRIAKLNLSGRATLHGAVAHPAEALAKMDLLVLPSSAEGFGLVLIEAMAAGIPVVAANVPGIRDVVEDNVNGLLVPPENPLALARAISRLFSDSARRQTLIAGGKTSVSERFAWDRVLPQYAALLEIRKRRA